jgi:hypothetical protein
VLRTRETVAVETPAWRATSLRDEADLMIASPEAADPNPRSFPGQIETI